MAVVDSDTEDVALWAGPASELGLAALLMGAALFLSAPVAMILAVQVWQFADRTPAVVLLHAWLARAGILIAVLTALTSVGLGIRGFRLAASLHRPSGLAIAGLSINLAALGLWAIAAVAVLNTTESLLRLYGL